MFESGGPPSKNSDIIPPAMFEQHSIASLKDSVSSITYRISEIQANLSRKIDRSQCLGILDKKVNIGHLKHYLEELEEKIKEDQKQEEERNNKMQEISIEKINNLSQKIKSINQKVLKQENKTPKIKSALKEKERLLKPQQLFIQTNETMFSLIIDQISKLQEKNTQFDKQLEIRNKKVINLNNQVCKKIEKLENQIQQRLRSKVISTEPAQGKYFASSWSQMDRNNKQTIHKGSQMEGSTFESIRLELITKNIEALQKQMLTKINIKDILPIVRQNTQSFTDSNQELRDYIEESVESMRKILSSQTQINRQLSLGIRCGWWHSYTQQNDIAIINKQLINLVPQIFELPSSNKHNNFINIAQQGLYIIRIYPLIHISNFLSDHSTISEQQDEFEVMIGTEVHIIGGQSVLRLQKNSEIRVILRSHAEIVIYMQKL